jgi:hypothetical protein
VVVVLLFMSMGRDYVSELWPQTVLLFISQAIYEYGERRWNESAIDVSEVLTASAIRALIAMIIEAVRISETSVYFNKTTERSISELCDFQKQL